MISVDSADKALKEVYLGVIGNQLNLGSNPLLTKIKQTTNNVQGFEVVKSICYGMSGGVTAAAEGDELPGSYNKQYLQFRANLKNLYGTIEITNAKIVDGGDILIKTVDNSQSLAEYTGREISEVYLVNTEYGYGIVVMFVTSELDCFEEDALVLDIENYEDAYKLNAFL